MQAYHQYCVGSRTALQITIKGALDSQPQVKSLPVACPWSLVLSGLLPPLKTGRHDIAERGVKHNKSN